MKILEAARITAFEDRMVEMVTVDRPDVAATLGPDGIRQLVRDTIEVGRQHEIDTEGALAVLIELTVAFGRSFKLSPDRAWANAMMARQDLPGGLRLSMMQERMTAGMDDRVMVRMTPAGKT